MVFSSLTGCGTVRYFYQAGKGQLGILNHARPLEEVIQDEKTPPRVRTLLKEVPAIKKHGEANGLKPTRNYTEYVKLDRRAAVWVVSACEPLKFVSKEWGFPIVGRFPYLGWYDLDQGKVFAAELKAEGWDVDVRGAGAYSTLGWFRDAILSSMIPEGPEALGDLINVILHESVHATLYISGQAFFDESLASFVADKMAPAYLTVLKGSKSEELRSYLQSEVDGEVSQKRLHEAYMRLNELYASSASDSEKLERKKKILGDLQTELKARREITNATLIQYKEYHSGKGEFEELYVACGKDWKRFLSALSRLTEKSFSRSQQDDLAPVLKPLAQGGC